MGPHDYGIERDRSQNWLKACDAGCERHPGRSPLPFRVERGDRHSPFTITAPIQETVIRDILPGVKVEVRVEKRTGSSEPEAQEHPRPRNRLSP